MAIDRDSITRAIFQGTRTPAKDFSSPVVQGYSPDICGDACTYQPDKARALLAEAGGFTGKLTIAYNADGSNKASIDAICNSIKNTLAISCVGKSYPDFKSLRDPVTTFKMDGAYRSGWQMDYPSLENFLQPIYSTGASSNTTKYTDPAFDALLRKGDTAEISTKRSSPTRRPRGPHRVDAGHPAVVLQHHRWLRQDRQQRQVRHLRRACLHGHHEEVGPTDRPHLDRPTDRPEASTVHALPGWVQQGEAEQVAESTATAVVAAEVGRPAHRVAASPHVADVVGPRLERATNTVRP